jgi:glycosyltransferase involved in cell wall biosynthesis
MTIAIDISQVVYETGVSTYTRNLVTGLSQVPQLHLCVFGGTLRRRSALNTFISTLPTTVSSTIFPLAPSLLDFFWNRLHSFPPDWVLPHYDVLHTSDWTEPPTSRPKVTTIHDLAPLLYPRETHPKIVSVHKRKLEWVKRETAVIIVPSHSVREDLLTHGFSSKSIVVIPEAADPMFIPSNTSDIASILPRYGITRKYFLAIGVGGRKNTTRLLSAFSSFPDYQLVIVGRVSEEYSRLPNVIFTGHISKEDIVHLYSGAQALVYPSLYEGFGLPILEAMSCGCPVVTSSIPSLLEIAGTAAVFIDPLDTASLVHGMKVVLSKRSHYTSLGFSHVKRFSWKNTAQKTVSVYKSVV